MCNVKFSCFAVNPQHSHSDAAEQSAAQVACDSDRAHKQEAVLFVCFIHCWCFVYCFVFCLFRADKCWHSFSTQVGIIELTEFHICLSSGSRFHFAI